MGGIFRSLRPRSFDEKRRHFVSLARLAGVFLTVLLQSPAWPLETADEHLGDRDSTVSAKYEFTLNIGRGVPVCTAFLARLKATEFQRPPFCGIPESDSIPGFSPLHRVYLSDDEIQTLYPRILSFYTELRQTDSIQKYKADEARARTGVSLLAWRYDPAISVQNNGKPDNVQVWEGIQIPFGGSSDECGDVFTYGPTSVETGWRVYQTAFVLTPDNEQIDEARTKSLFGHPKGQTVQLKGGKSYKLEGFRAIGSSMGFFKFNGKYYLETFFNRTGDFDGRRAETDDLEARQPGTSVEDVLGVFLRMNGRTKEVCEYQMKQVPK